MSGVEPGKKKQQLVAGSIGNVLEWYDFAVYGFLAPFMGPLFFPDDNTVVALIKTYGIFAAGYFMRPIGGILFGHIGDRIGRKQALQWSISMMAIPTVIVGLLPTHEQIGVWAAVLLVGLRMIQGVSVGGELIGSMAYLVETARPDRRGFAGSWSVFGGVAGILLGSAVVAVLELSLDEGAMASWGWRVPFISGLIIFFIGSWMRRTMEESEEFQAAATEGSENPFKVVMRDHLSRVLHASATIFLYGTSFYMLFVWMPTYLSDIVKPGIPHALEVNSIAMVLLLITIPVAGWVSDKVGRKNVLMPSILLLGIVAYPAFLGLDMGNENIDLLIMLGFAVLVGFIQGPVPVTMVDTFPVGVRYTAIAMSYNLTLAFFGGTAPLVCTWLIELTGDLASPAIYLSVLATISAICLAVLKPDRGASY